MFKKCLNDVLRVMVHLGNIGRSGWLNWVVLEVFFSLGDSMILEMHFIQSCMGAGSIYSALQLL